MSQYPLCEKYGLKEKRFQELAAGKIVSCFEASDVEALLAYGVEVFGYVNSSDFQLTNNGKHTHSGLLLNYKEIPKPLEPVSVEYLVNSLKHLSQHRILSEHAMDNVLNDLINRLQKVGLK